MTSYSTPLELLHATEAQKKKKKIHLHVHTIRCKGYVHAAFSSKVLPHCQSIIVAAKGCTSDKPLLHAAWIIPT